MLVLTVFVALSQPGEDGTHTASTDESGKNVTSGCVEVFITSRKVKTLVWVVIPTSLMVRKGLTFCLLFYQEVFLKGSRLVTVYCDHRVGSGCNDSPDVALTQGNGVW